MTDIVYLAVGGAFRGATDHCHPFNGVLNSALGTGKEDSMSKFKDMNGKWRNNERQAVLEFFECRLKEYTEQKLGRGGAKMLAVLLGVSTSTVQQWIHFESMPPSDKQCHIAHILGVPRSEIWVYRKELFPIAAEIIREQKKLYRLMHTYQDQLQSILTGNVA